MAALELILTGLAGKLLHDLAGPFVKDLGHILKDELRPYRAKQQKRLAEKTVRMLQKAEVEVHAVPPKLLVEIFDRGGLEDDEELHTLWATLLANAASNPDSVGTAFLDILRQLSRNDVFFLEEIRTTSINRHKEMKPPSKRPYSYQTNLVGLLLGVKSQTQRLFIEAFARQNMSPPTGHDSFGLSMDNLLRLRLIQEDLDIEQGQERFGGKIIVTEYFRVTRLGAAFIEACQPPKKVSQL